MFKTVSLTFVQYSLLLWIILSRHLLAENLFLIFAQLTGGFIGVWAIWEMRKSKLNIASNIRENATLVNTGPYRLVRHPMYLALVLSILPMLSVNRTWIDLILFGLFFTNLVFKLEYEEGLLNSHFPEFDQYKNKTWKLIPYFY